MADRHRAAIRLFFCEDCEHKLRFGAARCGLCGHRTPVVNRRSTWLLSIVAVLLVAQVSYILIA